MRSWLATYRRSTNLGSIGMIATPKCHTWPNQKLQSGRNQNGRLSVFDKLYPGKNSKPLWQCSKCTFPPMQMFCCSSCMDTDLYSVKASGDGVSRTNTPVIKSEKNMTYINSQWFTPSPTTFEVYLEVYSLHHVFLDPFNRSSKDPRWSDPPG